MKISAVRTGTSKSKQAGTKATSEITNRYYTVSEYRSLTPDQKQKLHELRKKRKTASGNSKVAAVEASKSSTDKLSDASQDGNRNHPALTRQKKRTKS